MTPLPLVLTDRIRDAYAAWGLNAPAPDAATSPEALAEMLSSAEPRMPAMGCRLYPSRFDPNDALLRAFPQPAHPHWVSLERALRTAGATSVMTRLPPFWQLESPIHTACRNIGAPLFVSEPENPPVGAAAVATAGIDAIIIEAAAAAEFAELLRQKRTPLPRFWFLIHRADAATWETPEALRSAGITVAQEVHLMPGLAMFNQCPMLTARKEGLFHVSDSYLYEQFSGRSYLTSLGDDPLPLQRLEAPCATTEEHTCGCGRSSIIHA